MSEKILIVDDEVEIADLIEVYLKNENYTVFKFYTAMEALEQLQMQGRKIGVISHVQEMSERISVQVQVHKKVNGKSVLTLQR